MRGESVGTADRISLHAALPGQVNLGVGYRGLAALLFVNGNPMAEERRNGADS